MKQVGAALERAEHVEMGNAAAGSVRDAVFHRQHDGRTMKGVDQLRGDDPDHATVPSLAGDDEHRPRAHGRIGLDDLPGSRQNPRFLLLTPDVLAVELQRQGPHLLAQRLVGREQQPRGDIRGAHAAGRVHARRQHERNVIAVDGLAGQPGHVEQGPQAYLMRAARQQIEADLRDDAVLADERHDIGERAEGGDLDEARQPAVVVRLAAERLHELQRHAHTRQVLVRIGAIASLRVDHGERRRQLGVGLVMVGDDQIDAVFAGATCGVGAANAAVDRDDQRDAVGMQPIDGRRLQAVPILDPFGEEVHDVGAEQLERPAKDHRGGDAVHVVVAVDRDPLPPADSRENPIDRRPHVGQRHRIVKMIDRGVQEAVRQFRVAQAALAQQASDHRRNTERRRQAVGAASSHASIPSRGNVGISVGPSFA